MPELSADRRVPTPVVALGYREFRLFWLASIVSNVGSMTQLAALTWVVKDEYDSALRVTLVAVIGLLPMAIASPIGGSLADRLPRRNLLLASVIGQTILGTALALAFQFDSAPYSALIVFSLLGGTVGSIGAPVQQAIVTELVPPDALRNAVSLNSVQWNISRAIGPLVAGVLIDLVGATAAFWVNAASFAAIIVALVSIRPRHPTDPSTEGYWADFVSSLRYARANRGVWICLAFGGVTALMLSPLQWLVSVIAQDAFGVGPAAYGLLGSAFGFGSIVGASILLPLERRTTHSRVIGIASFVMAGFVGLLAVAPTFWLGVIAMAGAGMAFMPTLSTVVAAMQALTADEFRGRVMALWMMCFGLLAPIAVLVQGAIAEVAGIRVSLGATAAVAGAIAMRFQVTGSLRLVDPPATESPDDQLAPKAAEIDDAKTGSSES